MPGVSYRNLLLIPRRQAGRAVLPRHAGHAAARPDRQVRGRRLSPRSRQRSFESIDERQRGGVCRSSGECARVAAGKLPATNVWLWGLGRTPALRPFIDEYGSTGKMITAVDLLRGLAALIGWERIEVPGATGYLDTDYAAKGRYAIEALSTTDIICVHVEATDEASHEGRADAKIKALEEIDANIVGPAARCAAATRRLSHLGLARSSDAASIQDAQPRRRAVCDRRQRREAGRGERL